MATPFANPKRQFRARRDTSLAPIHNIYSFYESVSSESESKDVREIDIKTLTLEQYLALNLNKTRRRIINPGDATFEIKGQFLRQLRKTTFLGSSTKNAIEHIRKVLEVASLFNANDSALLRSYPGLTTTEALKLIQELADHSHKWHNEESEKNTPTPFGIITNKLKALDHEMDKLRVDVRKINTNKEKKSLHEEIKSIRTSEISYDKSYPKSNIHLTNFKDTFEHYLKESCKRQDVLNEWMKKFMINTEMNIEDHDSSIKRLEENVETFAKKVKRGILKEESEEEPIHTTLVNTEHTQHLQKLVSHEIKIKELSMVKLNTRCSAILQTELPPKEKDPGSFILPCTIGTTTVSNALADLGASISIMHFSFFKRLGLGNPKPINMVIEMADRSMQSLKGIIENVLVKINKFIFPVDFIILDIIEDDKVPIILGRHMLASAHARIDVFSKKISLEVGTKQITFNINERESPAVLSLVYVINTFSDVNEFYEPRNLEELLISDDINGDLGSFLKDNDLFPDLESDDTMSLSPSGSARLINDSNGMFCNPNSNSSLSLDDFVEMDD
ncbi:homeodomain-like protein, partial [Tanacetum coccineum]